MKTSKHMIQTMAVALAFVCFVAKVSASVTYQIGDTEFLENFNMSIDSSSISGLAGGIKIKETSGGDSTTPPNYVTVCTDIGATLFIGQSYTYDSPVTPFSGHSGIDPQWGTGSNDGSAAKAIQNAAYIFNTFGQLTTSGLGGGLVNDAAVQLAAWDVLYNTGINGNVISTLETSGPNIGDIIGSRFDVTGGDAAAISLANTWITALNNLPNVGGFGYTGFLLYPNPDTAAGTVNPSFGSSEPPQELLIQSVPEATTIIAGALLLLPLGASTFRILNKKRSA